ncbi:MAG: response regulator [Alphaproteobacteria bacterium]|jgi:two-component system chemotaxis sensor kinase CheA|nr:response regulator [Alphaproteobacteria bacterium]
MDDLLSEFLTETAENLSVLDLELVKLEQTPNDPGLLSNIFRLVHTIKGTCGFLGLPRLETVAHAAENVLGKFRDGRLEVTPEAVTLILQSLDTIKAILAELEAKEEEPAGDDAALIANLNLLAEGEQPDLDTLPASPLGPQPAPQAQPAAMAADPAEARADDMAAAMAEMAAADAAFAAAPQTEPVVEPEPEPAPQPVPEPAPAAKAPAPKAEPAAPSEAVETKDSAVAAQTIRVNVELLENLMTMVSELVLTRNQVMQILRNQKESEFAAPLQRLNHVTSELQEGVMKTRMQPIGNAWAKLPRLIRDLSHDLGKKIDLEMLGADTELDRQVLELIKDPLTHMIRNSADHGVEMPADRAAAGKTETGHVRLNAYHEGGHIIIQIADDGRGLNIEKIKAKALATGVAGEAELAAMTEQQVQQLIFKAGFSTAANVTSVSGRGVGMDVVRTNIEKIGGTIELKSVEGRGSTFTIKIPLTLAIVNALIVECGGERFAIPQISVVELVRAGGQSEHTVEKIHGTPVLRLRDRLLPLVSLRKLLKLDTAGGSESEQFIIVTQVGTYSFGIIVDRVFDTEEIVVKPVAPIMRHIEMFSGNTILGDGSVIMILDPNGIASSTGEISFAEEASHAAETKHKAHHEERMALLIFKAAGGAPKAVPLALVARLEEVEQKSIEISNGQMMVQYRGKLMPLVPFDPGSAIDRDGDGRKPVLVFTDRDRSMGLVVDEIVDIVEEYMQVELSGDGPGLLGSAIIDGKATDVIDAGYYLTQAYRDWFTSKGEAMVEEEHHERVLLVDDSPFFRNMLAPMLSVAGYTVTPVQSVDEAMALCDAGQDFDIIISDIEMPGMNGFDFAEKVKKNGCRWHHTPMVALSSHATPRDLDRGRRAGFNDYVAKFDRDTLLASLSETLSETRGTA